MRYHNPESGVDLDLGDLSQERRAFYRLALEKFHENVSWFDFERFAFAFASPIFRQSHSRKDVLGTPLYLAIKDMWLQLGINQGFVAPSKERTSGPPAEKSGATGAYRTANPGNVEAPDQPRISSRRGR